ncbi:signal peptidase I [Terricaulis sp.]|uniref:signal peptidase I n=1 Tax=Terricaulis sp. TaxID=2768686 RepID=UPI003782EB83
MSDVNAKYEARGEEKKSSFELLEWGKTIAGAFLVYLGFTTVAFANYAIPSESMVPHLEVGDRVVVSKFSYGYSRFSLPFNLGVMLSRGEHRLFEQMPHRGDVAVFVHPFDNTKVMIKRIIGLPGDVIEVRDGVLFINGEESTTSQPTTLLRLVRGGSRISREFARRYEETIPGGVTHAVHDLTDAGRLDNFGPYTVPAGHFFAMGDNRDNSADSRDMNAMGPVPIENLIGRAEIVYYATGCGNDHTVACPMPRWMKPLHH